MEKAERESAIRSYKELTIEEIQSLIQQKDSHIEFYGKIKPYNGDPEWKARCSQEKWWAQGYTGIVGSKQKPLLALRDILLSIGGCEASLPAYEEDLENIIKYGQLWDNRPKTMRKDRSHSCHANAAEFWLSNMDSIKHGHAVTICTGYALSADIILQ